MFILFDIGGTNLRVAMSNDLVKIGAQVKLNTPLAFEEGFSLLCETITTMADGEPLQGIAGGIRGPLNAQKTGIMSEGILTDWVGRDITTALSQRFGAPAFLENDTAIVGLGEVHFGAGRGHEIVAYHTVSTGVGGARYIDGKLDRARVGFEPGHQFLDFDRSFLGASVPPTLENLVSGKALERERGVKAYEIPQTDPIWQELAMRLAAGLRNTIFYWSPDVIVLGGSMIVGNPRIPLDSIRHYTEGILQGFVPCPLICDAEFRDDGGLYGAMALLRLHHSTPR